MRLTRIIALGSLASLYLLSAACSDSSVDPNAFGRAGSGGKAGSASSQGGQAGASTNPEGGEGGAVQGEGGASSGSGGSISVLGGGGSSGAAGTGTGTCKDNGTPDQDGDGWTIEEGDCNDCDPFVNPGAIDVLNYVKDAEGKPTEELLPLDKQIDEDCDGKPRAKDEVLSCDEGLGNATGDAFEAARAMGICNVNVEQTPSDPKNRKWGVIKAGFNTISGAFLKGPAVPKNQVGILPNFGADTEPREGVRLLGLSSGAARAPGQPGYNAGQCELSGSPLISISQNAPGFPKPVTCTNYEGDTPEGAPPYDGMALDLMIRVPTNAKSLKFNFRFFSCEYPQYVCDSFNDVFAVIMTPSPLTSGDPMHDPGTQSANIAFDASKGVIGVNNKDFLTACEPSNFYEFTSSGPKLTSKPNGYGGCKKDSGKLLQGSGFEGHAASAWLATQVPVPPPGGKQAAIIYLRFAIWDSGDYQLDSTALIDNFQWSAEEGSSQPVTVVDPPPQID